MTSSKNGSGKRSSLVMRLFDVGDYLPFAFQRHYHRT